MRWSVERQGGVAGMVSVALALAAMVFERGVARGGTADATIRHFQDQAGAVRAQTLLFVLGAACLLWFLAGLRARLRKADSDGALAALALAAGAASTGITLVALAVQEALTLETPSVALAALNDALFLVAGVPLAVLLAAVAVLALTRGALPAWIGWLSVVAAALQLVPVFAMVVPDGPWGPGGWLSAFLPYPLYVIWLGAVAVVMTISPWERRTRIRRSSDGAARPAEPAHALPAAERTAEPVPATRRSRTR